MIFFGPDGQDWDAPATDGREIIPPPVGVQCVLCELFIQAGDRGVLIPGLGVGYTREKWLVLAATDGKQRLWPVTDDGQERPYTLTVYHRECFLRHVGVPSGAIVRPRSMPV